MSNPFDYIANIRSKTPKLDPTAHNPFMVNRGFSYYKDCVLYANEMNRNYGSLSADMQYEFLYNIIPRGKQVYGKWAKTEKDEDVELIQDYFQVNRQRATEILSLINKDVIDMIHERIYKGGTK